MTGVLSCGGFGFFISKSKTIVKPIWLRNVALLVPTFLLKLFLSPQKNEWWLSDNTFLILSALCTIVCLWIDNQRIKACRQVRNLYALPSALVAGGSVLSLHGGRGPVGHGRADFWLLRLFLRPPYAVKPCPHSVCRPRYEVVQIVHTSVQTVQTSADKSAECRQ